MKKLLKRLWEKWKVIAHHIAKFQTALIISVFYLIIISPLGLIFKIFGWDPLNSSKRKANRQTNWETTDNGEPDISSMSRLS